jgi:hypothetical protein
MGGLVEKLPESEAEKMFREADQDGDGSINFEEFQKLLLPPDNKPIVCGKFIGEKKPGETRILRCAILKDDEGLVDNYRGMKNLKDIFETVSKESPEKPFLGTRAKTIGENGAITYGDY